MHFSGGPSPQAPPLLHGQKKQIAMPFDKDRYPPDWREISARIRRRDEYTCQHCGAHPGEVGVHLASGEWVLTSTLLARVERGEAPPAQGSLFESAPAQPLHYGKEKTCVLTVAHLDRDESNWQVQDSRLITLCAACHLRYDAEDNARRRAYGRAYKDRQLRIFKTARL